MIKSSELRIGNYFNHNGSRVDILTIKKKTSETKCGIIVHHKNLEPIPLTEEWLLKFGFEKVSEDSYKITTNGLELKLAKEYYYKFYIGQDYEFEFCKGFLYIHNLQNLVHALTGEELTIK